MKVCFSELFHLNFKSMKRMTFLSVDLGNQVLSNRQCLFGFNEKKKKIETKQRKIWDNREIEKYRQKK